MSYAVGPAAHVQCGEKSSFSRRNSLWGFFFFFLFFFLLHFIDLLLFISRESSARHFHQPEMCVTTPVLYKFDPSIFIYPTLLPLVRVWKAESYDMSKHRELPFPKFRSSMVLYSIAAMPNNDDIQVRGQQPAIRASTSLAVTSSVMVQVARLEVLIVESELESKLEPHLV